MKITFLGHACLQIETQGKSIVVDPFIRPNELAKSIDFSSLKPDYILITHAHGDHIADVEDLAKQSGAKLISNAEIIGYYAAKGFEGHMMNTGGSWNFDFGKLKATIAFHSSSFPDGTYGGNPNGYVIESDGKRIYIAGDTSLTQEMKLIPETIGALDLAILPIGDNFTMGLEDAVFASDFVKCNTVLGYHFDTFGYIKIVHDQAKSLFSEKGKILHLLEIGENISL